VARASARGAAWRSLRPLGPHQRAVAEVLAVAPARPVSSSATRELALGSGGALRKLAAGSSSDYEATMLRPGSNDRRESHPSRVTAMRFDPSKSSAIRYERQVAQRQVIPGSGSAAQLPPLQAMKTADLVVLQPFGSKKAYSTLNQ